MTTGWYLQADGATHRLHDVDGWKDASIPPGVADPAAWPGAELGLADVRSLTDSIRDVLPLASEVELHAGGGRLTASSRTADGSVSASFSSDLMPAMRRGFTCVISPEEAERLADLPFSHGNVLVSSDAEWAPVLVLRALVGPGPARIPCLRAPAPGLHRMARSERFLGGAVVASSELLRVLSASSAELFELRFSPGGLRAVPRDGDGVIAEGYVDVPTRGVSREPVSGAFLRANLRVFAERLSPLADALELRLVSVEGAGRSLRVGPHGPESDRGFYLQKETVLG